MNIRQERFADLVASGMAAAPAYIEAGFKVSPDVAKANASRLLANASVRARVDELRAKASEKAEMKRSDLVALLSAAITTPIGQIDENHALAQEVVIETSGRRRVKSMGKIEAARLLCEILGWKSPEQHVVEAKPSTLESLQERARFVRSGLNLAHREAGHAS